MQMFSGTNGRRIPCKRCHLPSRQPGQSSPRQLPPSYPGVTNDFDSREPRSSANVSWLKTSSVTAACERKEARQTESEIFLGTGISSHRVTLLSPRTGPLPHPCPTRLPGRAVPPQQSRAAGISGHTGGGEDSICLQGTRADFKPRL